MADEPSPLETEIRRLIAVAGPMPVAEYMRLCLTHPQYGYYLTHDPIGADGDFITAPEISQMFGELIGLWMASVWQQMGAPENVRVVELGPGRGTLMVDALRAARVVKDFRTAAVVHLVEISPALQRVQQRRLQGSRRADLVAPALDDVPGGPTIIVANEFIDALPIHQAVKRAGGWHERVVEIAPDGRLVFGVARDPLPHFDATLPRALRQSPEGSIFEWRSDAWRLSSDGACAQSGGCSMLDYGHAHQGLGETLQAVAGHAFADPLRAPGKVDLTAHVDFAALAQSAETIGARVHGPVSQRDFLLRLGIDERAAALKAQRHARECRRDRLALLAPDQPGGPARHGRLVQGPCHRGPEVRSAAGLRDKGEPVQMMIKAETLALSGIRHAFFTREGGVSGGLYASLNGGVGSRDDADHVAENRARMAAALAVEPDRLLTAYQIHSPHVVVAEAPWPIADVRAPTPSSRACPPSPSA